jgi:hypothetical protein
VNRDCHVPPPVTSNYTIGGFRVPVICISPYSEQGSLNTQDARESPFYDCFNFRQRPRFFIPIPTSARYNANYFLHQQPSNTAPDDE